MQIFNNLSLNETPSIYNDYLGIINYINNEIEKTEDTDIKNLYLESKKFITKYPLDCLKDIDILDNQVTMSYDCTRSNPKIGGYGLIITFKLDNNKMILETSVNYKNNLTIDEKEIKNDTKIYDKLMKTILEDCLLNNWNFEKNKMVLNDTSSLNSFIVKIIDKIFLFYNNKYLQVKKNYNGLDGIFIKISPKNIGRDETYLNLIEDQDSIKIVLHNGITNLNTEDVINKDIDENNLELKINSLISSLRKQKLLLYAYSINNLNLKKINLKKD